MEIGTGNWKELIHRSAKALGVETTPAHLEAFSMHARELLFWNRKTNLTAVTDPGQVALKHFVDSLVPARWIPADAALLDIGSGGGFPGIPLKVVLPGVSATLIDAARKKVSFLKHVIRRLGLSGIEAVHARAEQMAPERFPRRGYDVIVSRALGAPEALPPLVLPLLGENGIVIAMLGKAPPSSSAMGTRFGPLAVFDAFDYRLPGLDAARSIWCMRLH